MSTSKPPDPPPAQPSAVSSFSSSTSSVLAASATLLEASPAPSGSRLSASFCSAFCMLACPDIRRRADRLQQGRGSALCAHRQHPSVHPALFVGLFRRLKAQRDAKYGIDPSTADTDDKGKKRSFFYGRWTDATTLSLFLVNAVVALIIAMIPLRSHGTHRFRAHRHASVSGRAVPDRP